MHRQRPSTRRLVSFFASAVDAALALGISHLISPATTHAMNTHPARSVRLTDFKTEDAFILFGSPRSDPWVELFANQLDFTFEFDNTMRSEFIRNKHPQNRELTSYIPTAQDPKGPSRHFEILLRVSTMAGSRIHSR
jgi:hypothetical protein